MTRLTINLPDVLAEVDAAFARYEDALVNNDVEVLDELFWHIAARRCATAPPRTSSASTRSARFRAGALAGAAWRATLAHTVITTFGRDFATADDRVPRANDGSHARRPPEPDLGALRRKAGASSPRT